MMKAGLLALFAVFSAALPAAAQSEIFGPETVPNEDLARMRGGLILPSGLEIALAVRQDTSIDGALVLRTTYVVNEGAPQLDILTPAPGQNVIAPSRSAAQDGAGLPAGGGTVVIDRDGGIAVYQPGFDMPAGIAVTSAQSRTPPSNDGLVTVMLQPGESANSASGTLTLENLPAGARIGLQSMGTEISHLVGQAIGTVIANTADDRTIDTVSVVDINLSNVPADLIGSGMLMVENVALEAARLGVQ